MGVGWALEGLVCLQVPSTSSHMETGRCGEVGGGGGGVRLLAGISRLGRDGSMEGPGLQAPREGI